MSKERYPEEFKVEAVKQVKEASYKVSGGKYDELIDFRGSRYVLISLL
jgi:hypothetical protein